MRAVILAGGLGTRLAPYTTIVPKPLMPIGNRPILEIIICQLRNHGFTEMTLAIGYLSHLLCAYFDDGYRFGVTIDYSYEEKPLGTAGPLTLLPDFNEPVLVMNADVLTDINYSDLYNFHCKNEAAVTIAMYNKEVKIDFGVLKLDAASEVQEYIEKPTYSYLVSTGIYIVSPEVIARLPKGERIDFPDLVRMLLAEGQKVIGYTFNGEWLDIGRPDDCGRALEMVKSLDTSLPEMIPTPRFSLNVKSPEMVSNRSNG
ncbi:MAG TPA: nucleoside-diphosphate-sugar pyrophosphorylase [Chloroflexi bacterium]|nr:nucleoside-diphosphate-sugar pyrophosphorylase [Chloroflexota bacterium]